MAPRTQLADWSMAIAWRRGWPLSRVVRALSGKRPGALREAADWARAATAHHATPACGVRILITGGGGAFHAQAVAIARAMAATVPQHDGCFPGEPADEEGPPPAQPLGVVAVDASQGAMALSNILNLPRSPGLSELCQYRARFEEVIYRDERSPLHLVPSGRPRTVGGPWGDPGVADRIFRALDGSYRYVLFCAAFDEGLMLAEAMMRPFSAAIVLAHGDPNEERCAGQLERLALPVRAVRA